MTLDNSKLGGLFDEIGSLLGRASLENRGIVESLKGLKDAGGISGALAEALEAFDRIAPLCENMYISSIASWASLSNFISSEAKKIEKEMLDGVGPEIYRADYLAFRETIQRITEGLSGAPTAMQEKALYYAYQSFQAHLSEKRRDPFRLNNFAQVGAGKTYTTPIFLKLFSCLIHQKWAGRRRPHQTAHILFHRSQPLPKRHQLHGRDRCFQRNAASDPIKEAAHYSSQGR